MSQVIPIDAKKSLAERFWGLARAMGATGINHDSRDPVAVVKHVLAVLDAMDTDARGADLSVQTLSFLKLLRESEIKGDLTYASPEQVRGEELDERSLVFSVGVLLFERLTGRHPFGAEGNSQRRVARIRKGELGSGVNFFPTVPAGLRSVLMRAMGPFREERFATLAELRARLDQFISDQAPAPRLPGTGEPSVTTERTLVVRKATDFARDLMIAAQSHERRDRQQGTGEDGPKTLKFTPAAESAREASQIILLEPSMVRGAPQDSQAAESNSPVPEAAEAPAAEIAPSSIARATAEIDPDDYDETLARAVTSPLSRSTREHDDFMAASARALDTRASGDSHRPTSALAGRLIWLAMGAGLAVVAMLLILPRSTPTTPAEPADVAAKPAAAAIAQPEKPAPAEPEPEAPPVAPAVFTPELGGTRAAERARACFAPDRLSGDIYFRVGLLYPPRDGGSTKVYFAPTDEITPQERGCVRDALIGVEAGAPPEKGIVIDYQIHLSAQSSDAVIR